MRDRLLRDVIEFGQRAGDRAGGRFARAVDHARDLGAVVHHRARKGEASFFDRLDRLICRAGHLARELIALLGDGRQHAAALVGQDRGHFISTPADRRRDFLGFADEAAGNLFADADKCALRIAGAVANCLGGGQRKLTERSLGFRRVDLDRLAQLFQPRIKCIRSGFGAGLDLACDGLSAADKEFLEAADTAVKIVGDLKGARPQVFRSRQSWR